MDITDTLDSDYGTVLCEHHSCRCARAAELAAMADATGDGRLLREAVDVHSQRVVCRKADEWAGACATALRDASRRSLGEDS